MKSRDDLIRMIARLKHELAEERKKTMHIKSALSDKFETIIDDEITEREDERAELMAKIARLEFRIERLLEERAIWEDERAHLMTTGKQDTLSE